MRLSDAQTDRFYAVWIPLLLFVNEQRRLVPRLLGMTQTSSLPVPEAMQLREALWADESLREAFLAQNPANLSTDDLALVDSWRYRRAGSFFVLRHLKKHSIFLADKGKDVYAVLGLKSPLEEVVPFVPCMVQAVLLPFEGQITYDGLLNAYNVTFGSGYRSSFHQTYEDAKERGAIITSLVPGEHVLSPEEQQADLHATNTKVLDAFRKYLYQSNLSTKVVERDVGQAADFADKYLAQMPEPRSLRAFDEAEVENYLATSRAAGTHTDAQYRQILTSFKRFFKFLRDTKRMDYDTAEAGLEMLKR